MTVTGGRGCDRDRGRGWKGIRLPEGDSGGRRRHKNLLVSGSVTLLPLLTGLTELDVENTQVGVPTEQQLATFTQQHQGCYFVHDE